MRQYCHLTPYIRRPTGLLQSQQGHNRGTHHRRGSGREAYPGQYTHRRGHQGQAGSVRQPPRTEHRIWWISVILGKHFIYPGPLPRRQDGWQTADSGRGARRVDQSKICRIYTRSSILPSPYAAPLPGGREPAWACSRVGRCEQPHIPNHRRKP